MSIIVVLCPRSGDLEASPPPSTPKARRIFGKPRALEDHTGATEELCSRRGRSGFGRRGSCRWSPPILLLGESLRVPSHLFPLELSALR